MGNFDFCRHILFFEMTNEALTEELAGAIIWLARLG